MIQKNRQKMTTLILYIKAGQDTYGSTMLIIDHKIMI